ncbi:hypothetical protein NFJ02_10g03430 [Pycnococcus provasolii]
MSVRMSAFGSNLITANQEPGTPRGEENVTADGQQFNRYYFPLPSEVPPDLAATKTDDDALGSSTLAAPPLQSTFEHPAETKEHRSFYGHYDVFPVWNQYHPAVDSGAFSPLSGFTRLRYRAAATDDPSIVKDGSVAPTRDTAHFLYRVPARGEKAGAFPGMSGAMKNLARASASMELQHADAPRIGDDLWKRFQTINAEGMGTVDINELAMWASRVAPRSIHDLKPLLILMQGLLQHLCSNRLNIYSGEVIELKSAMSKLRLSEQMMQKQLEEAMAEVSESQQDDKRISIMTKLTRAVALAKDEQAETAKAQLTEMEAGIVAGADAELRAQLDLLKKELSELRFSLQDCNKNCRDLQDENDKLKKKVAAAEGENAKLGAGMADAANDHVLVRGFANLEDELTTINNNLLQNKALSLIEKKRMQDEYNVMKEQVDSINQLGFAEFMKRMRKEVMELRKPSEASDPLEELVGRQSVNEKRHLGLVLGSRIATLLPAAAKVTFPADAPKDFIGYQPIATLPNAAVISFLGKRKVALPPNSKVSHPTLERVRIDLPPLSVIAFDQEATVDIPEMSTCSSQCTLITSGETYPAGQPLPSGEYSIPPASEVVLPEGKPGQYHPCSVPNGARISIPEVESANDVELTDEGHAVFTDGGKYQIFHARGGSGANDKPQTPGHQTTGSNASAGLVKCLLPDDSLIELPSVGHGHSAYDIELPAGCNAELPTPSPSTESSSAEDDEIFARLDANHNATTIYVPPGTKITAPPDQGSTSFIKEGETIALPLFPAVKTVLHVPPGTKVDYPSPHPKNATELAFAFMSQGALSTAASLGADGHVLGTDLKHPNRTVEALSQLPTSYVASILKDVEPDTAGLLLNLMKPDDATSVIGGLATDRVGLDLGILASKDAEAAQKLLGMAQTDRVGEIDDIMKQVLAAVKAVRKMNKGENMGPRDLAALVKDMPSSCATAMMNMIPASLAIETLGVLSKSGYKLQAEKVVGRLGEISKDARELRPIQDQIRNRALTIMPKIPEASETDELDIDPNLIAAARSTQDRHVSLNLMFHADTMMEVDRLAAEAIDNLKERFGIRMSLLVLEEDEEEIESPRKKGKGEEEEDAKKPIFDEASAATHIQRHFRGMKEREAFLQRKDSGMLPGQQREGGADSSHLEAEPSTTADGDDEEKIVGYQKLLVDMVHTTELMETQYPTEESVKEVEDLMEQTKTIMAPLRSKNGLMVVPIFVPGTTKCVGYCFGRFGHCHACGQHIPDDVLYSVILQEVAAAYGAAYLRMDTLESEMAAIVKEAIRDGSVPKAKNKRMRKIYSDIYRRNQIKLAKRLNKDKLRILLYEIKRYPNATENVVRIMDALLVSIDEYANIKKFIGKKLDTFPKEFKELWKATQKSLDLSTRSDRYLVKLMKLFSVKGGVITQKRYQGSKKLLNDITHKAAKKSSYAVSVVRTYVRAILQKFELDQQSFD